MTIRIILADDHGVVRDGLASLLQAEADLVVVGGAATGEEAVQMARDLRPDLAVMDIAMPDLNGIEAAEQIRLVSPDTQIIILSVYATSEYIYRAFQAGARGYLLKELAGSEVVAALRAVLAGRRYLSQRIADTVLDGYLEERANLREQNPLDSLSPREREILQLVAEGHASSEIARRLSLSPRTVETYRSRLMAKLNLHDLPNLVKFAIEHGLTTLK